MKQITRERLYQSVWSHPLTKLAQDWNCDASKLATVCDAFDIARPKAGHWSRQANGKHTHIPDLSLERYTADRLLDIPQRRADDGSSLSCPTIRVPARIRKYEDDVLKTRREYEKRGYRRDVNLFSPINTECAALSVSDQTFGRALRILNTVYRYCREQNWEIGRKHERTVVMNVVTIDGEAVRFRLRERLKQHYRDLSPQEQADAAAGNYVYQLKVNRPTGRLFLSIEELASEGPRVWEDSKTQKVEDCVGQFIAGLQGAANKQRQRRLAREAQERRESERRIVFGRVRARADVWKQRIDTLNESFDQWRESESCRAFIRAVEQRMLCSGELSESQQEWLRWAKNVADIKDPTLRIVQMDTSGWTSTNELEVALRNIPEFTPEVLSAFEVSHSFDWFEQNTKESASQTGLHQP